MKGYIAGMLSGTNRTPQIPNSTHRTTYRNFVEALIINFKTVFVITTTKNDYFLIIIYFLMLLSYYIAKLLLVNTW